MKAAAEWRVAVVGAGPAGLYATRHLLDQPELNFEVDVFERLPTPWGLVRAGVAPDRPEKKRIIERQFNLTLGDSRVQYFGNVEVGRDVRVAELQAWYDAVIYAVGASSDVRMGIPGEELPGCWAARQFVGWYNGHPDYSQLQFDLSCRRAVVVGNGNVALDVARILMQPLAALQSTDIAEHALVTLAASRIEEVVILGRRGHFQGAFHNPELEALAELPGVDVLVDADELPAANEVVMDGADWATRRKVRTLQQLAARPASGARKRIVLRFLTSPVEVLGADKVEQLLVVRNHLQHDARGRLQARPTEEESILDTGLVLRAIGYRSYPLSGLPFDERRGVIANLDGRVTEIPGAYVTGWSRRGSRGIIGNNKKCARDTVASLLADLQAGKLACATLTGKEVVNQLNNRAIDWVSYSDWLYLDRLECEAGCAQQRARAKLTSIEQMLSRLEERKAQLPKDY
ncbi:MAG: FAD-dependent oxidoreductase [Gammaproteobacteria bacterium]|uniref:FAD-dependent oxidoreductase n=1 Tax=Pseudomaricurvus alcaniphilus TaxID=1166482 RepID=UPI001408C703|nr:FAD-dependent oxidoreductase [Gammaproteobacteria bacterium]NHN39848.1 FAD-dependent oxidoreductase [Pseudomaricurvus alcaniphilus]